MRVHRKAALVGKFTEILELTWLSVSGVLDPRLWGFRRATCWLAVVHTGPFRKSFLDPVAAQTL